MTMRGVAPFALMAALGACNANIDYYPEEWKGYYREPAQETTHKRVERKEIYHWTNDPKKKKRVGFLYRYELQLAGSRGKRDYYMIYDAPGVKAVGYITQEGVFHRFDRSGRLGEKVGEYPILDIGLKIFYGYPLKDSVGLEEIDPYADSR